MGTKPGLERLLLFNLATDSGDPILGFTTAWIAALSRHAGHIDVVTMRAGRLDVPPNVCVFSAGKELGYSQVRRGGRFYVILHRLLQKYDYDACFAHMMPLFALMAAPLLKRRRIPSTLWYVHRAAPPVLRSAEKVVDNIVTASETSFPIPSRKTIVSGHGIDTDLFAPSDDDRRDEGEFVILVAGRLAPIKRIEVVLDAVRLLLAGERPSEIRLRLVGPVLEREGDYAASLLARAEQAEVREHVEMAGPVPFSQMVQTYRESDLVVNLSPDGSFDKAPLEAMSCGVPIVTSNRDFGPLVSRVDPYLFVKEADPAAVASACRRLRLKSRHQRREIGHRLREIVMREHSLESLAQKLAVLLPGRQRDR